MIYQDFERLSDAFIFHRKRRSRIDLQISIQMVKSMMFKEKDYARKASLARIGLELNRLLAQS